MREEESPMDLFSSGEADFFSTGISGGGGFKALIEKGDMSDNAEAVGKDGEFISIAEMTVDIKLFGVRAGSGP